MVRLPGLRDVADPAVKEAMDRIPRHRFVPRSQVHLAYADQAVDIGSGQTISQPYIVAKMTECVRPAPGKRILEIGTGSGYQAAVLAELGCEVFSIEIVPELHERAREVLTELGYDKVHLRCGDGQAGWPEEAPFDGILITAATPKVPRGLFDQLADDGRLVVPLGKASGVQQLVCYRFQDGKLHRESILPVRFVPLTGGRLRRFLPRF